MEPGLGIPNEIRHFGISVLAAVTVRYRNTEYKIGTDTDTEWMIPFGIGIRYRSKTSSLTASNFEQLVLLKRNSSMFKAVLREDLNKGPDTGLQE